MAYVSERNDRHRPREVIARDLAFVLSSEMHLGTKYVVANNAIWAWTEHAGKYSRTLPATKAARALLRRPRAEWSGQIIHEHAVPRAWLIARLMNMSSPTADEVFSFLSRFAVAVLVTRDQHTRLPDLDADEDIAEPMIRYLRAGITVLEAEPED